MIDLERARHFIKVRHDGILATIKRDGRPQLSNILYFVDDDGREAPTRLLDLFDNPRHDARPVGRFDRGDHVIFLGDGVGQLDAFDGLKRLGDLARLSRRRVDEYIRPHDTLLVEFPPQDTGLAAAKMKAMTSMTAVVKAAAGPGAEIGQVEVPEPKGADVLIEVAASSICGTDVHIFDWNEWAQRHILPPRVFGHEMSGRILATGPDAKH